MGNEDDEIGDARGLGVVGSGENENNMKDEDKLLLDLYTLVWVGAQFQYVGVRADFIDGRIIDNPSPNLLREIDRAHSFLMPTADKVALSAFMDSTRINHIKNFIRGTGTDLEVKQTMMQIAHSSYWVAGAGSGANLRTTSTPKPLCSKKIGDSSDEKLLDINVKSEPRMYKTINFDRDSSSDESSLVSASSSDEESLKLEKKIRRKQYSFRSDKNQSVIYVPPLEVVKPVSFQMNGYQSLRRFFSSFERYFTQKYGGSSCECTQELVHFLPEEMVKVYDTLDGVNVKYKRMKTELIKWYDSQKKSTRYWKSELARATMDSEETLCLYGMRLRRIAEKAYPQSSSECMRELRHCYCKTVPQWFRSKMENLEDLKEQLGQSKRLTWEERMRLAEKEDKRQRVQASEDSKIVCQSSTSKPPKATHKPVKTDVKSKLGFNGTCFWCGKYGHREANC